MPDFAEVSLAPDHGDLASVVTRASCPYALHVILAPHVSDEGKRRPNDRNGGDAEEVARLHQQAHGVITGKSELPLPLVPEPTHPGGARPSGKRGDSLSLPPPVDDGETVPVPLLDADTLSREATPPPLPPSPASAAAEGWLEDAVTRPALGDLSGLSSPMVQSGNSGSAVRVDVDPVAALREAHVQAQRTARKLLVLSIVTAFAVGLAMGAMLLRGCG